jgi:hypothetical protein
MLTRLGVLLLVVGIVGIAGLPHDKGNSALTAGLGAVMLVPSLWNAWRGRQVAREYTFGPPPPLLPALMQLVDSLGNSYRSGGDLSPGQVQSIAAALGLAPIAHRRGKLGEVAAAVGRGRRAILFVNSKGLPGRRVSRAWYPILVLALARSHGRTVAQVVDPAVGHPEQLDAKRLVAAWKADDRYVTRMTIFKALGAGEASTSAPRMWLEV